MKLTHLAAIGSAITALLACTGVPPSSSTATRGFTLSSTDIAPGKPYPVENMLNTFGCTGGNKSPQLSWRGAPPGTKSFVLTMYDLDAPTGSGWWHWVVYNLPASTSTLPAAIGQGGGLPAGAVQARGDGGSASYGGPCPPQGVPAHRYVFTVHALKVDKLPVPPDASPALVGFMTTMNRIGQSSFTVLVGR
jgi:hypothetical protein